MQSKNDRMSSVSKATHSISQKSKSIPQPWMWKKLKLNGSMKTYKKFYQFSSVQFSCSVMSNCLQLQGLQYKRLPCKSPTSRAYAYSCPLSQWCYPNISSSVLPLISHFQSFPASGSFPMSQSFSKGGQSIGVSVSASVLLMNIQDWFPLGWTGYISLLPKELSWVFSSTTVQKHQLLGTQVSL